MKKLKYSIISLVILLTSCSEFLEPQSQTEYVPRDINSLNELLIGNAYIDPNAQNAYFFLYHEIMSDDVSITSETTNHTNNQAKYSKAKPYFSWHPEMFNLGEENNYYFSVWKSHYDKILGCNAVLDYADKQSMKGTTTERSFVKGQALTLRAFYYLNLVNLFGEPYNYNKSALGVPLKLTSDMTYEGLKRSTVEQVYAQIVNDLNTAENEFLKLPVEQQFNKEARITLPAIQLLKARVALYMEDFDLCATYSKKVIDNWGLKLLDLNDFVSVAAAPYYQFSSYNNPEALWLYGYSGDFTRMFTEILSLNPNSTSITRRMYNASPALVSSFTSSDLRLKNYVIKESTTINNYMPYGKIPVSVTYSTDFNFFGKALRVSEAYIMLAEAFYHQNKASEAVAVLETLRAKRFAKTSGNDYKVPTTSTSGEALFQFIKEERRREMCFDGLRWFDLRRWGMESFSHVWKVEGVVEAVFTLEKNDPAFTLPIPFDAIEKNPYLEQNTLASPKY